MYGKMMDSLNEQMKPFADMTTIGTQAFEKLLKKHMDLAGDCFEAGLGQAGQFGSPKDLPALMSAQSAFMSDMGKKLFDLAKFDMDVMVEANQAMSGVIENGLKSMPGLAAKPKPKAV